MRIGRSLPPAAAPIALRDIICGVRGIFKGKKEVEHFEAELNEYFGVKYTFLLSSGKAALTIILRSLKEMFPGRNEVLIPAFSCYSLPSAIIRAGLKVRLCDIDTESMDFDYEQLSAVLSQDIDNILCIVPVHLFGLPSNIERVRSLIDARDVIIVEDAAQAMGGEYRGKNLGVLGDVGFFSLGRGKALSTVEGGIILTNRQDIAEQLIRFMEDIPDYSLLELLGLTLYAVALMVLQRPSLFWIPKSIPFLKLGETIYNPDFKMRKISSFQAGLARDWKRKIQSFGKLRSENIKEMLLGLERLGLIPSWGIQRPIPVLIRLPLRIESIRRRESILQMSEKQGFGIASTYPGSIDSIPILSHDSEESHFQNAKEYADKLVTLPVHPYMTAKDRNRITDMLAKAHLI